MKNIALFFIIIFLLVFGNVQSSICQEQINSLVHLKSLVKGYPSDVKLLDDVILSRRLKSLLKDRFFFLKKNWAVETPIEVKDNIFKVWGCQQNNCSNTNFIIVIDFAKNVVYVGIRDEENVKVYSENGSRNILVTNWANRTN